MRNNPQSSVIQLSRALIIQLRLLSFLFVVLGRMPPVFLSATSASAFGFVPPRWRLGLCRVGAPGLLRRAPPPAPQPRRRDEASCRRPRTLPAPAPSPFACPRAATHHPSPHCHPGRRRQLDLGELACLSLCPQPRERAPPTSAAGRLCARASSAHLHCWPPVCAQERERESRGDGICWVEERDGRWAHGFLIYLFFC